MSHIAMQAPPLTRCVRRADRANFLARLCDESILCSPFAPK
jgi:hypothetical protein